MSASFVVQEQRHGDSQQEEEQKVEEEGYAFNLSVPIGLWFVAQSKRRRVVVFILVFLVVLANRTEIHRYSIGCVHLRDDEKYTQKAN